MAVSYLQTILWFVQQGSFFNGFKNKKIQKKRLIKFLSCFAHKQGVCRYLEIIES